MRSVRRVLCAVLLCGVGALFTGAIAAPAGAAADVSATTAPEDGYNLLDWYGSAHDAGLLVNMPRQVNFPAASVPDVIGSQPVAETIVPRGSAVTLADMTMGSGARVHAPRRSTAPRGHRPPITLPNFVGRPLGRVVSWAQHHDVQLDLALGPLRDATRPALYGNYRVARQSLAAGAVARGKLVITARQLARTVGVPVTETLAPCTAPAGWHTIADDGTAVVMTRAPGVLAYGGCDPAVNRLFVLGAETPLPDPRAEDHPVIDPPLLAGEYAGVTSSECGTDGCSFSFVVVDLTTGAVAHSLSESPGVGGTFVVPVVLDALDAQGDVVYMASSGPDGNPCAASGCTADLWAATSAGNTLLDQTQPPAGDAYPFSGVAINEDTVTWTTNGVVKSAPLG